MTYKEKVQIEEPLQINESNDGGVLGCPYQYDYLSASEEICQMFCNGEYNNDTCTACWSQEYKEANK